MVSFEHRQTQRVINNYPSPPQYVFNSKGNAFYSPFEDYISMPFIEFHDDSEFYYSTFFHELVHSTDHILTRIFFSLVQPYSTKVLTHDGLNGCTAFTICPFHANLSVLNEIQFLRKNVAQYIHTYIHTRKAIKMRSYLITLIYFSLEKPILLKS